MDNPSPFRSRLRTGPAGPLNGVKVLDLSAYIAGPYGCTLLADQGADVVKVERPGTGDDTRAWGPPYLKDEEGTDTTEAAYYLAANRGKRSVTVDLAHPEGQRVVRLLADRLMVMKGGHVVESGLTDQVLDDPQHAYTQLLVSSVLQV